MYQAGYLLNTQSHNVEIKVNQTTKQAIVNEEPTGTFTIIKENSDGTAKIEGVTYNLWSADGTYNQKHTTSSTGEIKVEGLKLRTILLSGIINY